MSYNIRTTGTNINILNNTQDVEVLIDGSLIVNQDLTVLGTTTTLDTTNLLVEDPIIVTGTGNATDATDLGIIMTRGVSGNVALFWDESTDEFVLVQTTSDGTTAGDMNITTYESLHINNSRVEGTVYIGNLVLTDNDVFYIGAIDLVTPGVVFDTGDTYEYDRTANTYNWDIATVLEMSLSATALDLQDNNITTTGIVTGNTLASTVAIGTAPFTVISTTLVSNLNADQVDGLDSTALVLVDGTQPLTADWDAGAFDITAEQFHSDIAIGTSPFTVVSTTLVSNLNSDLLDGFEASAFPNRTDTTVDPVATDDLALHQIGSVWINTTDDGIFINVDNTDDAAIWAEVTTGGGDFSNVLLKDGSVALTADWNAGSFKIATTGKVECGDFESTGITDVATTGQQVEIFDTQMLLGDATPGDIYGIGLNFNPTGGHIWFGADSDNSLTIYADSHPTTPRDIILKSNGSDVLFFDDSSATWSLFANQLVSTITTGTPPFIVASTTAVTNLNADQVDGLDGTDIAQLANANEFTKTQNFNATTLTPLGADLVTNGGYATDTDWTKDTNWTIATNVASSDGTQAGDADLTQAISITTGKTYQVTFTVLNYSAGNVTAVIGDTEGTDRAANGTYVEYIVAGAGTDVDIRADLDFIGDIDDVIVKLANVSWDLESNQVSSITLDGNLVIDAPTNLVDGAIYHLTVKQDATGSRTVTWASEFLWPGGTAPTLSSGSSAIDVITFICDGINMLGKAELNYS